MDHPNRREYPPVRHLLGVVMTETEHAKNKSPSVPDVVALLNDRPVDGLARGQIGTVVESLDDKTVLVEFSDDEGRAYAIASCPSSELLVLHYVPQAA